MKNCNSRKELCHKTGAIHLNVQRKIRLHLIVAISEGFMKEVAFDSNINGNDNKQNKTK